MTIGQVCTRSVVFAHHDETVVEAARRMRDRHVGNVIVADADRRPIGMLTDRDIVVSAVAQAPDRVSSLLVSDVMTQPLITVRAHEALDTVLALMREHGIRRVPVLTADGRLEGVIALDDILRVMAEELTSLAVLVAQEQRHERIARP